MYSGEMNFDGLIGPTHNYSGLSEGNIASIKNSKQTSNPKKAALQGLKKMKLLMELGFPQGIFLPHERPHLGFLRDKGFKGNDKNIIASAAKKSKLLLNQAYSASSMWAANAATFSPSIDSYDSMAHITPANLLSMQHRSLETEFTYEQLNIIFHKSHFKVHNAIKPNEFLGDEGAANHLRLSSNHLKKGLQVFVYGNEANQDHSNILVRQSKEASELIAKLHMLDEGNIFFLKQNINSIKKGCFHNDIVSLATENIFIYHEEAFEDSKKQISNLETKLQSEKENFFIEISNQEISLDILIKSYLLNSQLITKKNGEMAFIMPEEVNEHLECKRWLKKLKDETPIKDLRYIDIKQSMMNGGGPACLRFKIVVTEEEFNNINSDFILTDNLILKLEDLIQSSYRDALEIDDLEDPALISESFEILDNLTQIFNTGSIYSFQK
tara:strand:- start:1120 stop:2442 length:1323 start_codon:yes stop_codon:yes gene_type:complete